MAKQEVNTTMTNKILNILGIIILAFVPQFLIDAYKDIQAELAKPVAKPVAKKQAETKAPAKKRNRSQKKQAVVDTMAEILAD